MHINVLLTELGQLWGMYRPCMYIPKGSKHFSNSREQGFDASYALLIDLQSGLYQVHGSICRTRLKFYRWQHDHYIDMTWHMLRIFGRWKL
jgi:hypothetical protein